MPLVLRIEADGSCHPVLIRIIIASGGVSSGTIDASLLVGMVVVSCIPTTIASNVVMTRTAGGDDAAATVEVVIGNVAGSFLSPLLIYGFFPPDAILDPYRPAAPGALGPMYANTIQQLGLSVLLPLVIGQALRSIWQRQVEWALSKFYLGKLSQVCLVLVIW